MKVDEGEVQSDLSVERMNGDGLRKKAHGV